jgi:hypothetical protein
VSAVRLTVLAGAAPVIDEATFLAYAHDVVGTLAAAGYDDFHIRPEARTISLPSTPGVGREEAFVAVVRAARQHALNYWDDGAQVLAYDVLT